MTNAAPAVDRYLEIAERQFAETGFHGVSLAALAKEAGVSKQALLHFFGTKEKLYGAVLNRLSDRLCAEVAKAGTGDPAAGLVTYFEGLAKYSLERQAEARLVVRALLDTEETARFWPMKPYLEALTELARKTPKWQTAPLDEIRAGLFQLIGAIQYLTISQTALTGMYGEEDRQAIEERFVDTISGSIRAFVDA